MRDLGPRFTEARREAGLTQASLASLARVCLATVQSIEAGRANPALGTLEALLAPLGLGLTVHEEPADWDRLAFLGLPLSAPGPAPGPATAEELARQVHRAARELSREPEAPDGGRKRECLRALLLGIRVHFPDIHQRWFSRSGPVGRLCSSFSGREVKLARIALARLAEYL
jgi:transcriptional regulator with XRE-family HTH domain